jgi:hypothetical protein
MNPSATYLAITLRRIEARTAKPIIPKQAKPKPKPPAIIGYYGTVDSVIGVDRRRRPNDPTAVDTAIKGIVREYITPPTEREDPTFGNEKLLRGIPAVGRVGGVIFGTRPGDSAKALED